MRGRSSLRALLLALALLLGLAAPAWGSNMRLTYQMTGSNTVSLTLQGLGEEGVYGAQLELTVPGNVTAAFSPDSAGAYSPDCRVETSDKNTHITIYLTAQEPLNQKSVLPLGVLTLSKAFSMPSSVTVTLLDRELEAITGAKGTAIPTAQRQTSGGTDSSDDGGDDEPTRYRVRVSSAKNGTVTTDVVKAEPRRLVTITVEPEDRYRLENLQVTGAKGNVMDLTDVGGDRYTFRMPAVDVEVTASFVWTGESHVPMNFRDVVESDWYHDAIHFVYENGMMNGTDQGEFSPEVDTSRGMIVTILHRMEGTPAAALSGFTDVPVGEYYTGAVGWASQSGIVSGYGEGGEGRFGPNDSITREQLAAILYRYAAGKGLDMTIRGDLTGFYDSAAISDYARDAMSWAVGVGLISGMGDGTVSPGGNASRAQVATILMRYCQNLAG